MQSPRIITVYQSLYKHNQVLGAERDPIMLAGLIAAVVGIGGMSLLGLISALLFWVFALFALRKMAKIDPLMSKVFLRHFNQQIFYSAKSMSWIREAYKV